MPSISRLRSFFYGFSPTKISLGRGSRVNRGSSIFFKGKAKFDAGISLTARGGKIIFGNNFSANEQVIFNADVGGNLIFGDNCLIGPRCVFRTASHKFETLEIPIRAQKHSFEDIIIGDDVWIGAGVIVLPGVSIGNHSIIGAGAVVTKSLPVGCVAVGVPAKILKMRIN